MKKKKITYGVMGMMEYLAVVKIGKSTMRVPFTDGSVSAMGVTPATFTTESLMVQEAIEGSNDYARGKIKTISVVDLGELCSCTDQNTEVQAHVQPSPQEEAVTVEAVAVEFSNNDDARDYLENNFGVSRSKLRNREIIETVARSYGVDIAWV